MPFTITQLDETPQRQGTVVYLFLVVESGEPHHKIGVQIPEQIYLRIGEPQISKEALYKLAETWLQSHLDDGSFNPFRQPSGTLPPVPLAVADHWIAHGKLP